jgi:hypothetical protein
MSGKTWDQLRVEELVRGKGFETLKRRLPFDEDAYRFECVYCGLLFEIHEVVYSDGDGWACHEDWLRERA